MPNAQRVVAVILTVVCISIILCLSVVPSSPIVKDSRNSKALRRTAAIKTVVRTNQKTDVTSLVRDVNRRLSDTKQASLNPTVAEMEQRQRLLSDMCHKHLPDGGPVSILKTMSVNTDKNFMYCKIPKVATTTWKRTLAKGLGAPRRITYEQIMRKYLPELSRYGQTQRRRILRDYYSFLFVRHPFERIVSAWRNKFVEMVYDSPKKKPFQHYNEMIKRRYRSGGRAGKVTFQEFVKFLIDPWSERPYNPHWRPFHQLCRPCLVHYNFIGHYETIHQDADYLISKLGLLDVDFPESSRKNSSSLVSEQIATLTKYQLRKLKQIYKLDFLLFGYTDELDT